MSDANLKANFLILSCPREYQTFIWSPDFSWPLKDLRTIIIRNQCHAREKSQTGKLAKLVSNWFVYFEWTEHHSIFIPLLTHVSHNLSLSTNIQIICEHSELKNIEIFKNSPRYLELFIAFLAGPVLFLVIFLIQKQSSKAVSQSETNFMTLKAVKHHFQDGRC